MELVQASLVIILLMIVTDAYKGKFECYYDFCILDKIDENRRNWLLHLQRMPQNRIPLKSYHYRPQGRRTIGRPKKRWREQL
jgi:hypothetical protein